MALIKCKECGKEISNQAKVCPNCGCPVGTSSAQLVYPQGSPYGATSQRSTYAGQNKSASAGKNSGMSIVAFILSILGCTSIIALILAIVDLTKKDGRKKGFSIAAVIISCIWLLIAVAGMTGNNNYKSASETVTNQYTPDTVTVDEVVPETPTTEANETAPAPTEPVAQESEDKFYLGDKWENKYVSVSFDACGDYISDNTFIQPVDGRKFIYATFTFENVGSSDTTVAYWDFDCYADGYACDGTYGADDAGFSQTLSAGRKITGTVYFEVPNDATEIELEFSPSFWSSKKVVFVYK